MLVSHECPTCGAPIQAPDDVGPIHCRFCGRDFERKEPPHQPVAAASTPNVPSASVPPSTVPALPWALAIGTLVVVAVVVAGGFMVFRAPAPETATAATTAPPTVQAAPKPAPAAPPSTAPAPSAPEVSARADLEPGPFTLTWGGTVRSSADPEPRVGAACTLTGSFSVAETGRPRCDHLVLRCAGRVYYDSAAKLEGMESYSFQLSEAPVAGEAGAYRYGILLKDLGSRTGERAQITLDTQKQMVEAFRDDAPSFRIKLEVDQESPIRRGRPVFAQTLPPFPDVVTKTATVTSKTGRPPFSSRACTLQISPGFATKQTCRVTLTCGGKVIYGAGSTGYNECQLADGATGAPLGFVDPYPTPVNGEPELSADLGAHTARLSDTNKAGATYTVGFTLD